MELLKLKRILFKPRPGRVGPVSNFTLEQPGPRVGSNGMLIYSEQAVTAGEAGAGPLDRFGSPASSGNRRSVEGKPSPKENRKDSVVSRIMKSSDSAEAGVSPENIKGGTKSSKSGKKKKRKRKKSKKEEVLVENGPSKVYTQSEDICEVEVLDTINLEAVGEMETRKDTRCEDCLMEHSHQSNSVQPSFLSDFSFIFKDDISLHADTESVTNSTNKIITETDHVGDAREKKEKKSRKKRRRRRRSKIDNKRASTPLQRAIETSLQKVESKINSGKSKGGKAGKKEKSAPVPRRDPSRLPPPQTWDQLEDQSGE